MGWNDHFLNAGEDEKDMECPYCGSEEVSRTGYEDEILYHCELCEKTWG
jgi:transposase-like protein